MRDKQVRYNGVMVSAEWPSRIEAAQGIHAYVINGETYARIRYGDEQFVAGLTFPLPEPCHDCAVLRGQYHVEVICDMEECPRCHEQVIGCHCVYEGDDPEEAE